MINAVINHGDGTLVLELPHNIYGIHEKLMSIGYYGGPHRVPLTDNEGDQVIAGVNHFFICFHNC